MSEAGKMQMMRILRRAGRMLPAAMAAAAVLCGSCAAGEPEKEETVYVMADPAGEVQKVIVSDWLKNHAGEDILEDETLLTDIENLKGEETWTAGEDGSLVWDAQGNDIFYQGTSDQELPVTITVHCMLDGVETPPEELAGKSGEVTVRYEYENHLTNGDLHVPFAAVTVFLLDEDTFHDPQVVNGRLISDGDHTIAVGAAFPGIAEDLDSPAYASARKLTEAQVPDYVEVTGQAENFQWNTSYTMITNEFFRSGEADISGWIDTVFKKWYSLTGGIDKIADGVSSIKDGAGELKDGADTLVEGLGELTGNNETLLGGAQQIADAVLATVQEELEKEGLEVENLTMDNYAAVLGLLEKFAQGEKKERLSDAMEKLDGLKSFYEGLVSYTDGVAAAKDGADQLDDGISTLKSGAAKLELGTGILKMALPDLTGVDEALKETVSLGEGYSSFAGVAEGTNGKVRFIWKVEGI